MARSRIILALIGIFSLGGIASLAFADEESTPPFTIKEVMKKAHKDGLLKKVLNEEASQEDKLMLLNLYVSMFESTPSKGDAESWQKLAGASALAAAKVAVGREGALPELKKATACAACHKAHKGD